MPEANFGPEARQTVIPEISAFNQLGFVVVELPEQPESPSVVDGLKDRIHRFVDKAKTAAKRYAAIPAVGLIAFVAVACNGGDEQDITIDTQTPTPTAEATLESPPSPTSEPTLAPVVQPDGGGSDGKFPTTPTATSTPEVKQEVPCVIVPQEYCSQARRITVDIDGQTIEFIGLNPPAGTPIFAPRDGYLSKGQENGDPFSGQLAVIEWDTGGVVLRGAIEFPDILYKNVKAGEQIGTVAASGGVDQFGIAFALSKKTPSGPVIDAAGTSLLFPDSLKYPIIPIPQKASGSPTSIIVYPPNR